METSLTDQALAVRVTADGATAVQAEAPPGAVVTGGVVTPEANSKGPRTQALRAECFPQCR
eukprot:4585418-Pyramimonas_sp.AAC.1